ncbi:NUDIX hydrolase [Sediminibacillus halophilus]|uniref:ADP-ribose pyrophosphatase n=1 Tax=Sediminibacillus halophilus TaxID=482461 RepID=A0A1G9N406_9BACI|nr:NUDIX hydrolase [Sediminibacillus halophilus]SDL81249.1 ADP-ribose pyrophosphatase [Sediminibacillus halophilus]
MVEHQTVIEASGMKIITNKYDKTYFHKKDNQSVVLLARDGDSFILIRQYREPVNDFVVQLPGGGVHPEESLDAAVKREFAEETGLCCEEAMYLGKIYAASWMSNDITHVYYSEAVSSGAGQKLEVHEKIDVLKIPIAECIEKIKQSVYNDTELCFAVLQVSLRGFLLPDRQ